VDIIKKRPKTPKKNANKNTHRGGRQLEKSVPHIKADRRLNGTHEKRKNEATQHNTYKKRTTDNGIQNPVTKKKPENR